MGLQRFFPIQLTQLNFWLKPNSEILPCLFSKIFKDVYADEQVAKTMPKFEDQVLQTQMQLKNVSEKI